MVAAYLNEIIALNYLLVFADLGLEFRVVSSLQHISRNVYRSIVDLLRFVIEGCEHSLQHKGAGGIASIFMLLEVMHTHYCGKRIQDVAGTARKTSAGQHQSKTDSTGQLSLGIDAKSDSSIVYTRGDLPPESDKYCLVNQYLVEFCQGAMSTFIGNFANCC